MIYLSRPKQHAYVSGSTNLTTPLCQDEATTPTLIQRPVMSSPSATSRVAVAGSTVPASLLCRICSAPVLPCRIRAPDRFIVVVVRAEMQFIGEEVETRSRASVEARLRGRMPRGARRVGQRLRGEAPRRRRYQDAVECGSNAQESHHGKRERGGEDSVVAAAAALAHPGPGGGRLCLRFARVRGVGNRGVVAGGDWGRFFLRGGVRQRREVWIEEHDGVGSVGGRPRWCAPAAGRRGAREKRMSEAESLRGGEN